MEGVTLNMENKTNSKIDLDSVFSVKNVSVNYGDFVAVKNVSMEMYKNKITAFIGPSGCGKSTLIRSFNRMNDLIQGAKVFGTINYQGVDLYDSNVDPVQVRRRIGMVFQKPNPFPKTIKENITFGLKVNNMIDNLDDRVEKALTQAALWDEVKDDLDKNALELSGGQQQRLCIARTIAVEPDTILMDEPCSALDPVATKRIEDLMQSLVKDFSILIVTHNMQQASRASDFCAFFTTKTSEDGKSRTGELVEFTDTNTMFTNPTKSLTEEYISGRFG
jgi:phosphate transport system ATP-binding protein